MHRNLELCKVNIPSCSLHHHCIVVVKLCQTNLMCDLVSQVSPQGRIQKSVWGGNRDIGGGGIMTVWVGGEED